MTKKTLLAGLLALVLAFSVAGMALAQGDGEARWVCISGFGCALTPETMDKLELVFPDKVILESGGDFVPDGPWQLLNAEFLIDCGGGVAIRVPEETALVAFTPVPDGGGSLYAVGLDTPDNAELKRLGPGIYALTMTFEQDGATVRFNHFTVMLSDSTMVGVLMATMTSADMGTCTIQRQFSGSAR